MKALLVVVAVVSSASAEGVREEPVVAIKTKVSKAKTESSLTVDQVSATLQLSYVEHIQRCYRDRFGKKPKASASGTMKLVFGVEPDGRTIGVVVASFDKKLDACVAGRARSWTFTPPKDKADKPIATSFVYEFTLAALPAAKPTGSDNVVMSEEEAAAHATMLTGAEVEPPLDSTRRPGASLGQQLEDVKNSGREVTVGGAGGRGGRVTPVRGSATTPDAPSGRIAVASKAALDASTLSAETVLAKIQSAYMAGLKRCYKTQLKSNPTLRGKLRMTFTVEATGTTSNVIAKSFDAALDACVKAMIENWRFPSPKSGDQPTTARFDYALALTPD